MFYHEKYIFTSLKFFLVTSLTLLVLQKDYKVLLIRSPLQVVSKSFQLPWQSSMCLYC